MAGPQGTSARSSLPAVTGCRTTPDAASDPEYLDPTFHDYRRTLSTHVNEMHNLMLSTAAEYVLDHTVGDKMKRTYDVGAHYLDKRDALIAWNEFICALVGAEHVIEASNIIPLGKSKAA